MPKSFPIRVFHLDLRIQVMTVKALYDLADSLISFGFNAIVLEWEATFPFKKHPTLANQHVYKRSEITNFIKYCHKIGLDTIPIQQCFGHVEYILRHDRYAHLREDERDICQVCPLKADQALPLFKELFTELASTHQSKYFYVGCDETYVLGKCPQCEAKAKKIGKSQLYVNYLKQVLAIINKMGMQPLCPADMLLKYPEAAKYLPKNTILVDWNYGWKPNHFGDPQKLYDAGFTFWGSLSLRSGPDNYYLLSWEKHLNNFRDFIPYSRKNNYQGIVLTSWSTSGIYGFVWDAFYETITMHPIRRVYPLNGFRILKAAFSQAVNLNKPFNPKNFIINYAKERFGLSDKNATHFYQSLMADPSPVYVPKTALYKPVNKVLPSVKSANQKLNAIKPISNKIEFEHFRLMNAIRLNYLYFKQIEATVESESYQDSKRIIAIRKLKILLRNEIKLSRRFSKLMKGYLHPSEIKVENEWRSCKWKSLLKTLEQKR